MITGMDTCSKRTPTKCRVIPRWPLSFAELVVRLASMIMTLASAKLRKTQNTKLSNIILLKLY